MLTSRQIPSAWGVILYCSKNSQPTTQHAEWGRGDDQSGGQSANRESPETASSSGTLQAKGGVGFRRTKRTASACLRVAQGQELATTAGYYGHLDGNYAAFCKFGGFVACGPRLNSHLTHCVISPRPAGAPSAAVASGFLFSFSKAPSLQTSARQQGTEIPGVPLNLTPMRSLMYMCPYSKCSLEW